MTARAPASPATADANGLVLLEEPTRLSESVLWKLRRAFFEAHGAGAWSRGLVPHDVTSGPFFARAATRRVLAFLRDLGALDDGEPLYLVELGAGPGRFGFHFLTAWRRLLERSPVAGRRFCYVLTDAADNLVDSWPRHPQLAELAAAGVLDFARFDLGTDDRLELRRSELTLESGTLANPLVVIANGAFQGVGQDAFAVEDGRLLECAVTLHAPPEMLPALAAGRVRSLDALRIGLVYRGVELPYYDDPFLDGLLDEYRRELGAGHLMLPRDALRALANLAGLSRRGLLLLSAGWGSGRLDELRDAPAPRPLGHGSVEFPVGYHAIGRWVEAAGGLALRPPPTSTRLTFNAFALGFAAAALPETTLAHGEKGDELGPDVFFVLKRLADDSAGLSFAHLLACLKLGCWDDKLFLLARPRLHELATAGLARAEQEALRDAAEQVWTGHLHLGEECDLAFELGTLLFAADLHRDAAVFFGRSLERYGEHSATLYNLALCHARDQQWDAALDACRRALELDGDNPRAAELGPRLEAARRGEGVARASLKATVKPARRRPPDAGYESNLAHLQGELVLLNLRLEGELTRWRATHPPETTGDELMGFKLTDLGADLTLAGLDAEDGGAAAGLGPRAALHAERERAAIAAGVELRLPELARRLGLDDFERAVVLLALAPELDPRYERLFGYLNDDMRRRWPTVEIALRLFCAGPEERVARRRAFGPDAPLFVRRLLFPVTEDVPRTVRTRGLRPEERTARYVLDGPAADPELAGFLERPAADADGADVTAAIDDEAVRDEIAALAGYLAGAPEPPPILTLSGPDALLLRRVAVHLAGGRGVLVLRGAAVAEADDPEDLVARALRDVDLAGAALLVEEADALREEGRPARALHELLTASCSRPRILAAAEDRPLPESCRTVPVLALRVPAPGRAAREELWRRSLDGFAQDVDLAELAARFRLKSAQIAAAAGRLRARRAAAGTPAAQDQVFTVCRAQCLVAAGGLVQHVVSPHGWDDLVLPAAVEEKLRGIERWLRFRHVVYEDWGLGERVMVGRGMAALFSGPSGTGKTMAAGIIARSLGLDLYRIDLATVLSKYVGDTEKNLGRIFDAAAAANAILFFDEADALFSGRTEVRNSQDRYANIEVSYLLQRMESYDGVTILATNLRRQLDGAFARRLHAVVEFPLPDPAERERIWRRLITERVPQDDDVDVGFLARQFALAGGGVKNAAVDAALAAAEAGTPVAMRHLVPAVARELEKAGRPMVASLFGPYADLVG